jgi:hypothetical protein
VADLYRADLGREADAPSLAADLAFLMAGGTIEEVEAGILASAEAQTLWGVAGAQSALVALNSPTHAADAVFGLYRRFLDRDPDAGSQGWVDLLHGGHSRTEVIADILGDSAAEFYDRVTR